MILRQDVYDAYWTFAAKRQDIFFNRIHGLNAPWSDDPILQEFKFCNTYRASDRASQYLIKNVIYKGIQDEEEVVFRILLFKIFNKIETWQHLESHLGTLSLTNFNCDRYSSLLQDAQRQGNAIYTSAYMSCANKAYGFDKKHQNHLSLIDHMIKDRLAAKLLKSSGLKDVFNLLSAYPLIGPFMAYQLAIDINYSEVTSFCENDFTVAGPGAERGIKKCFIDTGNKSNEWIIRWMVDQQEKEFSRLGLKFQSLWSRPLHLIDCQGLFCETDKYSRVAFPELKSNRKRIKSHFVCTPDPIVYFYPPKWNLNESVHAEMVATLINPHNQPRQLQLSGL